MPLQVDLSTGALGCWQEGTQIDQTLYRHSPAHQQTRQDRQQSQQQHASKPRSIPPIDLGLVSQRLWATAADGTAVPFTLLHKAGHARPTPQPLMVEVYGAYGHVLEAEFKPHRLTLLNRGWSVVLAHVRGGGELGQR
jgi:protease II